MIRGRRRSNEVRRRSRGASNVRPRRKQPRVPLARRLAPAAPWLLASLVAVLLVSAAIWLPRVLDHYPIQKVEVDGVHDARRQQQVQNALASLVRDSNYFSAPLDRIYERTRALSWVADVSVRRHWPGTIKLDIAERQPVAVWNESALVSGQGQPFKALKEYDLDKLPRLDGPDNRLEQVMSFYHSMGKVLGKVNLRITGMKVNDRLTATLTLNNGLQVVVDREHYVSKLRRFVRLYQGVLRNDSRQVARADLRYADGIAVTWRSDKPNA